MKTLYLTLIIISLPLLTKAQSNCFCDSEIYLNLGLNIVDSSGERNPLNIFDGSKTAFKTPLEFGVSYNISNKFGAYANLSSNGFSKNEQLDQVLIDENLSYFATDIGVRYFAYTYKINKRKKIILHADAGLGLFTIGNTTNMTTNVGLGGQYWLNRDMGIYANSLAKFASGHEYIYSNHFQHSFGLLFRIFN